MIGAMGNAFGGSPASVTAAGPEAEPRLDSGDMGTEYYMGGDYYDGGSMWLPDSYYGDGSGLMGDFPDSGGLGYAWC